MPASVVKASSSPCSVRFLTLSRFGSERSDPPFGRSFAAFSGDGELGLIGRAVFTEPLQTVRAHVLDQRHECTSLIGQRVLNPRRDLGEHAAVDDALVLERAQPQRERAGADPLERPFELAEARLPLGQLLDQQQRPLTADDLGGSANGTGIRR